MKKKTKIIILILTAILIIGTGTGIFVYLLHKQKKLEISNQIKLKESISIEIGSPLPTIKDFIENGNLGENAVISFPEEMTTDKENCNEENMCDAVVLTLGDFAVTITDGDKIYTSQLTIQDTTAPIAKFKDVTITEGDELKPDSFVESCSDNSRTDCTISYVNKDTNEELEKVDVSVGEREISLIASDASNNKTEAQVAKLTVKKKETKTTTTTKSSTSNKTSTSTSKNTTSNNNSTTSTTTEEVDACKPAPAASWNTNKNAVMFYRFPCGTKIYSDAYYDAAKKVKAMVEDGTIMYHPNIKKELEKCDAYFNDAGTCTDIIAGPFRYDSITKGYVYGLDVSFKMVYTDSREIIARGYIDENYNVHYWLKNVDY